MTSKVFSLVAQKLTKADFKEYKKTVNETLKRFTGRTLGASNLNECASAMLGAKDSNVMAALHKEQDVPTVIRNYLEVVKAQNESQEYQSLLNLHLIPMLELELNGETLRFCVDIYSPDPQFVDKPDNRPIALSLWLNAPYSDEHSANRMIYENVSEGGDYLSEHMTRFEWTRYIPEPTLLDALSGMVEDKPVKISKIKVTEIFKSLFSMDESVVRKDASGEMTCQDLEELMITGLTNMTVDLNMSLARNGHKRLMSREKDYSGRFSFMLS